MSLTRRLERVAEGVNRFTPDPPPEEFDLDEWAALFEDIGREGASAREPDYDRALAEFRQAVDRARAQSRPPFDPPARFRPDLRDGRGRRWAWQTPRRFPEPWRFVWWLGEMAMRARDGVPPVTESEFAELAAWLAAHHDRLVGLAGPGGKLVPGGKAVDVARHRRRVARGPRVLGAGRAAEEVRRLRLWYPGGSS